MNNRAARRQPRASGRFTGIVVGACVVLLTGGVTACSAPGSTLESAPAVTVTRINATLHDPVWSYALHALVAPTDDHRLAAVSHVGDGTAQTKLSAPMSLGRNIQISDADERHVFVPQPEQGRVAVVDLASLRQIDDFDAGPAPAYLAADAGMRVLLALSQDGYAVTPVDLYGYRKLATARAKDSATTIDGSNRGRQIEYHLYGPAGIRYYKGSSSPPEKRGDFDMDVVAAAGDSTKVSRTYVADRNRNVVYAVDSRRGGDGLGIVACTQVSSPIRYLGTDDTRIYAATDRDLVVFETASFTGYPQGSIPVLRTVDYRQQLPDDPVRSAPLSGMAIGPDRLYLTLQDQPYVIGVAKPHL
ncbi:hypothetical protein BST12_11515 [Mycobacterium angelicum]|uniref:BPP domain-containing protein n=1 Tax=Mycobacterium angelicum TaxID=470074 RepID=A0A1W9ZVA9_MYCAN|nr:hypothetical protein BST12_11515 [Mycobacterium angelicum]